MSEPSSDDVVLTRAEADALNRWLSWMYDAMPAVDWLMMPLTASETELANRALEKLGP